MVLSFEDLLPFHPHVGFIYMKGLMVGHSLPSVGTMSCGRDECSFSQLPIVIGSGLGFLVIKPLSGAQVNQGCKAQGKSADYDVCGNHMQRIWSRMTLTC